MVRKREATARGLLLTLIVHTWFGWLPASFLAWWGAMALTLAATASAMVGLHALIGRAGIAVGAILTMFVGNPLSSLAMPKEPGGRVVGVALSLIGRHRDEEVVHLEGMVEPDPA